MHGIQKFKDTYNVLNFLAKSMNQQKRAEYGFSVGMSIKSYQELEKIR